MKVQLVNYQLHYYASNDVPSSRKVKSLGKKFWYPCGKQVDNYLICPTKSERVWSEAYILEECSEWEVWTVGSVACLLPEYEIVKDESPDSIGYGLESETNPKRSYSQVLNAAGDSVEVFTTDWEIVQKS